MGPAKLSAGEAEETRLSPAQALAFPSPLGLTFTHILSSGEIEETRFSLAQALAFPSPAKHRYLHTLKFLRP
jgi:hypothetical protein